MGSALPGAMEIDMGLGMHEGMQLIIGTNATQIGNAPGHQPHGLACLRFFVSGCAHTMTTDPPAAHDSRNCGFAPHVHDGGAPPAPCPRQRSLSEVACQVAGRILQIYLRAG